MTEPGVVRLPMACPACSAVTAMPNMSSTSTAGATHVAMRCRRCGQEWSVEISTSVEATKLRSGVRLPRARPPGDESDKLT